MLLRVKVMKDGEEVGSIVLEEEEAYRIANFLKYLGHEVYLLSK